MKQSLIVDKRVAGIIKWLERLKQSYKTGAIESALMEAECARADLEVLRADVWSRIKPDEFKTRKLTSHLITFSKSALLAVIIVMAAVFPISKDPAKIENSINEITVAEPIVIIREAVNIPVKATTLKRPSKSPEKPVKKIQAEKIERTEKPEKKVAEKKVAYDDIFSLMETGQRALKNNRSVVKINR